MFGFMRFDRVQTGGASHEESDERVRRRRGAWGGGAGAQEYGVVPAGYANTNGTSSFLYMVTTGRTYQMQINASELTQFVGKNLTGLTWRLNANAANWPPSVNADFANFDIYIGPGVDPAARSTTFANNFTSAPTQVRSGPLTFAAGSFQGAGSPAPWGVEITFNEYLYTGGHLTIEIRHSGMTGNTTTTSFNALSTTTSGYGTRFSALWTGTYNGTTGGAGNFFVTRLTANEVPAPGALALLGAGLVMGGRRRRRA